MLRPLPDREVQQLHNDAGENEADQKSLDFVPEPRAQPLIRQFVASLQAKAVIVEPYAEYLADYQQEEEVHEDRKRIVLKAYLVGQIPQPEGPSRRQQDNQEDDSHGEIRDS